MVREGPGALADLAIVFLMLVCIVTLGTAITTWLGVSGIGEWIVGIVVIVAVVGTGLLGYWFVFLNDAEPAT